VVLGRDVEHFPYVEQPPGRDSGTIGDAPAPLVRIGGDVACLPGHSLEFCPQLWDGLRETPLFPGLLFVLVRELAGVACEVGGLLGQGGSQQLQVATGGRQHLVECLQPGGHGGPVPLGLLLLLLGALDPLTDHECLVGAGGCERVECVCLRLFRSVFACPCPLQVLFGLGQFQAHFLLPVVSPVQDLACVPHRKPGDAGGLRLGQGAHAVGVPPG
jgi:hypothetical protein